MATSKKVYLTRVEVAEMLRVSLGTVKRMLKRGDIRPAGRVGPGRRRVLFEPEEIDRYVRRTVK